MAKTLIASAAQKPSDFSGGMAMVYRQTFSRAALLFANLADSTLLQKHLIIILDRKAKFFKISYAIKPLDFFWVAKPITSLGTSHVLFTLFFAVRLSDFHALTTLSGFACRIDVNVLSDIFVTSLAMGTSRP